MRDFNRIDEILTDIRVLWINYPDMRLGQLLENFVFDKDTMFYQEDDVTDEKLKEAWEMLLQNN
jgi:hypothetical protein